MAPCSDLMSRDTNSEILSKYCCFSALNCSRRSSIQASARLLSRSTCCLSRSNWEWCSWQSDSIARSFSSSIRSCMLSNSDWSLCTLSCWRSASSCCSATWSLNRRSLRRASSSSAALSSERDSACHRQLSSCCTRSNSLVSAIVLTLRFRVCRNSLGAQTARVESTAACKYGSESKA